MTTDIENEIEKLLQEASRKLDEAASLAEENDGYFYWDGPAYGMGGSYYSKVYSNRWNSSNHGWMASSESC